MESLCGETEGRSEAISGRKNSRQKSLRTRILAKRAGEDEKAKFSQSESDITAGKGLGSEEDLACSQGMMGSRSLSHDSIFLADQVLTDVEPERILSQENVHSKIKSLQLKLLQQKLHLGPPPLVFHIKRSEDLESDCQDDILSRSPPKNSGIDIPTSPTFNKSIYQPLPLPFLLTPKLPLTKSVSQPTSHPSCLCVTSKSPTSESPLDFSSPAEFIPCLDTSAARHRVSIKPRNQRPSTKKKSAHTGDSGSHLPTRNNTEHPESVREEAVVTQKEIFDTEQKEADRPITSLCPSEKIPDAPEFPFKSSSLVEPLKDQALLGRMPSVPPPVLRVKPLRPADNTDTRRPHSSFIPSELTNKGEGRCEIAAVLCDKRNTFNKGGDTESPSEHPSVVEPSARGIKRPSPGSGSFHFSITTSRNRDVERPRSSSFLGVLEQTRVRTDGRTCSSMKEKLDFKDVRQRGSPLPGAALHKTSVLLWEKRDNQQKMEPAPSAQPTATGAASAEVEEEAERSQKTTEEPGEAQEAKNDEVKTAFGIKLRSTSQSVRLRSNCTARSAAFSDERGDDPKSQAVEISDSASYAPWKSSTSNDSQVSGDLCTSTDPQPTEPLSASDLLSDPAPPSSPIRNNLPLTCNPPITPTDLHMTSSHLREAETPPQEPQPTPHTAPSEVSWMSLAMEKTRSLQQLFAGRFPRDLVGGQARPHAHAATRTEALSGEQQQNSLTLNEAAKKPPTEAGKAEMLPNSQAQMVKPKTCPVQSHTSTEQQTNKYHSLLKTAQPASACPPLYTKQCPLSSTQTEASPQSAGAGVSQSLAQFYLSSGQQQPSPTWSDRGQVDNKCAASAPSAVSTCSPVTILPLFPASVRGETEECLQENENASFSGRRAIWSGSVSMKAAFLEKHAQWTNLSGTKGVEVKKASAEGQMSEESMASIKIMYLNKDIEEGQGLKPAESSPIKVPERSCEDKFLRKNLSPSNLPSPALPPALQSSSEGSQPSWMELAKRKSLAWSDKSMD